MNNVYLSFVNIGTFVLVHYKICLKQVQDDVPSDQIRALWAVQ